MSPLSLESICWPVEFLLLYPSLGTQYTAVDQNSSFHPSMVFASSASFTDFSYSVPDSAVDGRLWSRGKAPGNKQEMYFWARIPFQIFGNDNMRMDTCSVNYKTRLETNCQKVSYVTILYTNNEKVLGITLQIRSEVTGYINIRHTICKLHV